MGLHDTTHPLIIYYKETANKIFPLIMFIGREPNNINPYEDTIGGYDFDEAPRCSFWNIGYKIVGNINGFAVSDLKNKCRSKKSSPIIFSDSLPSPIPMRIKNKSKIRRKSNKNN